MGGRPRRWWAVAFAASLVASGCGSGGEPEAAVTAGPTTTLSAPEGDGTPVEAVTDTTVASEPLSPPMQPPMRSTLRDLDVYQVPLPASTQHCPPPPEESGPIRVGANGGGFTDWSHIDGIRDAIDSANATGGIAGRPIELVTSIEVESDNPRALHHINALLDGGDLHAIIPFGGFPDPTAVVHRFAEQCVPALFWLAEPAPLDPWVVPGLDDVRARAAAVAEYVANTSTAQRATVLVDDHLRPMLVAGVLVESLGLRGVTTDVVTRPPDDHDLDVLEALHDLGGDVVIPVYPPFACGELAPRIRAMRTDMRIVTLHRCGRLDEFAPEDVAGIEQIGWPEPATRRDVGRATGEALVATLRSVAESGEPVTGPNLLRAARSLHVTISEPWVLDLRTNATTDPFPVESAVMHRIDLDGTATGDTGIGIDANDTTLHVPLGALADPAEEESPCFGEPGLRTGHWFPGVDGGIDPGSDIVLTAAGVGFDVADEPDATVMATAGDAQLRLPMTLGNPLAMCAGEVYFDLALEHLPAINALGMPVQIHFEIRSDDRFVATGPVTFPDDFQLHPPFDAPPLDIAREDVAREDGAQEE